MVNVGGVVVVVWYREKRRLSECDKEERKEQKQVSVVNEVWEIEQPGTAK